MSSAVRVEGNIHKVCTQTFMYKHRPPPMCHEKTTKVSVQYNQFKTNKAQKKTSSYAAQMLPSPTPSVFSTPPLSHFMPWSFYDTGALEPPRRLGFVLRPGRFFGELVFESVPSMNLSSSSMLRESSPFRGSRPDVASAVWPT